MTFWGDKKGHSSTEIQTCIDPCHNLYNFELETMLLSDSF